MVAVKFTFVMLSLATLAAHDMWIEPSAFFTEAGQGLTVKLRVGQDLMGDPLPRDPASIRAFVVEDAAGRREIPGRVGRNPAGLLRVVAPGLMVLGYYSKPSPMDPQDAAKFNAYLKDEGLDAVLALRASRKELDKGGVREVFSRCAKSLILSGAVADAQADRALGFPLELVAERNPYGLPPGADLPLRLTYENRPLAGALVVAINKLNPTEKITARTGKDGRARLRLNASGGMWLVKAVHLVPAEASLNAEWQSYWASLTFEMKPRS